MAEQVDKLRKYSGMPVRCGVYKHYKGGTYSVLGTCYNSTNKANYEEMVYYVSHITGQVFVRSVKEFTEEVDGPHGIFMPRFVYISAFVPPITEET